MSSFPWLGLGLGPGPGPGLGQGVCVCEAMSGAAGGGVRPQIGRTP